MYESFKSSMWIKQNSCNTLFATIFSTSVCRLSWWDTRTYVWFLDKHRLSCLDHVHLFDQYLGHNHVLVKCRGTFGSRLLIDFEYC